MCLVERLGGSGAAVKKAFCQGHEVVPLDKTVVRTVCQSEFAQFKPVRDCRLSYTKMDQLSYNIRQQQHQQQVETIQDTSGMHEI